MSTPESGRGAAHDRRSRNHCRESRLQLADPAERSPRPDKLDALAAALAQVRLMGGRVVLVSSGAIAAGFGPLGFDSRPVDVATQQATAAVGQGLLMARYETAFGRFGIRVGQILITAEDYDSCHPVPQCGTHAGPSA